MELKKIASFTINHLDLMPGIYVSRKDPVGGEIVTTFDLRITAPNREPVMSTAEIHTFEHPQGVWGQDSLLWSYGLQDRLLPADDWRL